MLYPINYVATILQVATYICERRHSYLAAATYSTCLSLQVSFRNIRNVCTQTKVQATISDVAM